MNVTREMLEDQLQEYEMQMKSLKSFIKELNAKAAEHGTDEEHFEKDLLEAEHNIKFYEDEMARIKKEIRGSDKGGSTRDGGDSILPRTAKQGIGSLIISSISFLAGALLGSRMKSRRDSKDTPDEKSER